MKKGLIGIFMVIIGILSCCGVARAEDWENLPVKKLDDSVESNVNKDLQPNWRKIYDIFPQTVQVQGVYDGISYWDSSVWGYKYLDHYKVTFDANGGTNYAVDHITTTQYCTFGWLPEELITVETGKGVATGEINDLESRTMVVLGVVRSGYHLKGWSYDKAGEQMASVDDFMPESWEHGKTYTLYAQWEPAKDDRHNWDAVLSGKENVDEKVKKTEEEYQKEKAEAEAYQPKLDAGNTQAAKDSITITLEKKENVRYICKVSEDNFTSGVTKTVSSWDGNIQITGLESGKTYYIQVYTITAVEDVNGSKRNITGKKSETLAVTLGDKPNVTPNVPEDELIAATKAEYEKIEKAVKKVRVSLKSAKNEKGKKIKVTLKEVKGFSYQIQKATNKKFTKNKKSYTVKGPAKTIKKLKKKKTYYVRARVVKQVRYKGKTKKIYGKWSKVKKVKVKK